MTGHKTAIFDTTKRKPDYVLLGTIGTLVFLGLVMVYSASFVEAFRIHDNQYYYLIRQITGAFIGGVGMLVTLRINYQTWQRHSVLIMGIALVLLVLVLVLPESMTKVNNSRSWIRFGEGVLGLFSIQPSEIAKLALIIYLSDWLSRRSDRLGNVSYGLVPFAVMVGLVCGLVMLEPDLGTTVVIVMIAAIIYFVAGANIVHVLAATGIGAVVFFFMVRFALSENLRIKAFLDPWKYYDSAGYQPIHALFALGSGGIFGEGLGQARQKFQWLPQAHTDAILAIVGEELGLIGTMIVVIGFAVIAYRGYTIAARAPSPFAALVAVGITSWLVFQALLNIAVTTSLVPFTGLTLPFLSYGSTSLIMSLVSAGILLNISRHTVSREREEITDATIRSSSAINALINLPLWRRDRRPRLSSLGGRRSITGRSVRHRWER